MALLDQGIEAPDPQVVDVVAVEVVIIVVVIVIVVVVDGGVVVGIGGVGVVC